MLVIKKFVQINHKIKLNKPNKNLNYDIFHYFIYNLLQNYQRMMSLFQFTYSKLNFIFINISFYYINLFPFNIFSIQFTI